jgi:DNA-binding response OmpR family regulator
VDLVIVDHSLPGITGSELAKRLKEIKNVSVLMLSGNADLLEKPDSVDVTQAGQRSYLARRN